MAVCRVQIQPLNEIPNEAIKRLVSFNGKYTDIKILYEFTSTGVRVGYITFPSIIDAKNVVAELDQKSFDGIILSAKDMTLTEDSFEGDLLPKDLSLSRKEIPPPPQYRLPPQSFSRPPPRPYEMSRYEKQQQYVPKSEKPPPPTSIPGFSAPLPYSRVEPHSTRKPNQYNGAYMQPNPESFVSNRSESSETDKYDRSRYEKRDRYSRNDYQGRSSKQERSNTVFDNNLDSQDRNRSSSSSSRHHHRHSRHHHSSSSPSYSSDDGSRSNSRHHHSRHHRSHH